MKNIIGLGFVIALLFGIAFLLPDAMAQSVPPSQTATTKPLAEKTAGELYKNIQVLTDLKDARASEFLNTMNFMSGSLSVSCNYCHTGPFESDANKNKLTARDMIKMMRAINESNFGGRVVVTCNTCHQGSPRPNGKPSPWNKTPEQIAAYNKSVLAQPPNNSSAAGQPVSQPAEPAIALPDVDQVMANYRKAVGASVVKSIHMSGTNVISVRGSIPFEAYAIFPDRLLMTQNVQGIELSQILNADHGWSLSRRLSRQSRIALTPAQMAGFLKNNLELYLPVKYAKSEGTRKVTGIEKIGDRAYYVVESQTPKETERLFFDAQTGLLYKVRAESETRFGTIVNDTVFDDYREVNGVKMPYLITFHYMTDQVSYQFSEIQINIEVDPAKFDPPESKTVRIDPKILDTYIGDYQFTPTSVLTVSREGDRLFVMPPGFPGKIELFADTETDFFLTVANAQIIFVKNAQGQVSHLVLRQNKVDREMKKVK